MVIIGPESDPAKIKGLSNATEALKQIAKTNSPYIMNNIPSVRYLTGTLMAGAKLSENRSWFLDEGKMKGRAIKFAEKKQGYVIFGAFPFLRFKQKSNSKMKILVHTDPILQRVMVSVIVNPKKIKGVNLDAAKALQTFLLSKRTQARIAAFRAKGSNQQLWWPAARHNAMHSLK
jgi:tungstate transport system substrate-binding protein